MNFKDLINQKKLGIFLFGLSFIYLFIMTYIGLTNQSIWNDEQFTYALIQLPINQLIEIGVHDVHPPLYYLIFKFFIKIFELFNVYNIVLIGKFVSLTPFYLLIILAIVKIRKDFGLLTGAIFALCISSMPQFMIYSVELRMYSWALLFITASFVYVYELIRESSLKNWIILTILTICSVYTHYFSAIASIILYLLFLIYILYNKKEMIKALFISGLITIIAYIPWISIVLEQVSAVKDSFWIDPINLNTIITYVYFALSPANFVVKANELVNPSILGTLLLISIVFLIIYYIKSKKESKGNFAVFTILAFILVPISGIIISLIYKPIFHPRYLVPILGSFWLAISILLSKIYSKKEIFIPILALIMIVGVIGTYDFINIEEGELKETIELNNTFHNVFGSNNIIFFDSFSLYFRLGSYFLNDQYNLVWQTDDISQNIKEALNDPGIREKINNGSRVYFVDRFDSDYDNCVKNGLILEKKYVDSGFNNYTVYEIKLNESSV